MFCIKCGNELEEGALFCSKCGQGVKETKRNTLLIKEKVMQFKYLKYCLVTFAIMILAITSWNVYSYYFTESGRAKQCINNYFKSIMKDDIVKQKTYTTYDVKDYARITILNDYKCIDIMKKPIVTGGKTKEIVATYKIRVNGQSEKKLLIGLIDKYDDGKYKINSLVIDDGLKLEDIIN